MLTSLVARNKYSNLFHEFSAKNYWHIHIHAESVTKVYFLSIT